ncbi:MAG: outer membrane beta-barrel protein [Bauldia sp.]
MSRIQFLGASLIAIVAATGSAAAADLGTYEPPPVASYDSPASVFSWGGAYVGLQGGYQWTSVNDEYSDYTANGWMGGVYGGYNFAATPSFIIGLEADANLKGNKGNNGTTWYENPWDASLRLRAGFAVDRFLIYAAGGGTVGTIHVSDATSKDSSTRLGWNAGVGVEAAITDSLIGRVEFRHTDLGTDTYALDLGPTAVSSSSNALLLGVGMKF